MSRIAAFLACLITILVVVGLLGASCGGGGSAAVPSACPECPVCQTCPFCAACPVCPTPVCIEWIKPTFEPIWVDENVWYCVDEVKVVRFRGYVHYDGFCGEQWLSPFQMPVGLRPKNKVVFSSGIEMGPDGWLSVDVTPALNTSCGVGFTLEGKAYVAEQ